MEPIKKILCKVTSRGWLSELKKCLKTYSDLAVSPEEISWLFSFDTDKYHPESVIFKMRGM